MKKVPIILLLLSLIHTVVSRAQEVPEQQLENLAAETESDTEDDQQIQELEHFRRHPVNLNEAGAEELRQLALVRLCRWLQKPVSDSDKGNISYYYAWASCLKKG